MVSDLSSPSRYHIQADTERMHAEQQRTEKQAEQMELRAAEIPTEMDDLLEANKPLVCYPPSF